MNITHIQPNLKVINVYAQPDNKKRILKELMLTIDKIQKVEPGTQLIIAGDMNIEVDGKAWISRHVKTQMEKRDLNQIDCN